jgi:hypothetical protein
MDNASVATINVTVFEDWLCGGDCTEAQRNLVIEQVATDTIDALPVDPDRGPTEVVVTIAPGAAPFPIGLETSGAAPEVNGYLRMMRRLEGLQKLFTDGA